MRPTRIILHCSASAFGDASLIRTWHVDERGWADIGYHFVILNGFRRAGGLLRGDYDFGADGLVEPGRPLDSDNDIEGPEVGAHAYGHNRDTVGVCLIGERHFSGAQLLALDALVVRLRRRYGALALAGHCELDAGKTCPNLDMDWLRFWCGLYDRQEAA